MKNTLTQVSQESILRSILGANKIARMERVARANRVRELLASLGHAAMAMKPNERAHFAELVQLAQQEHCAADQAQDDEQEIEAIRHMAQEAMTGLQALLKENERINAMFLAATANNDAACSEQAGGQSVWKRLVNRNKTLQAKD